MHVMTMTGVGMDGNLLALLWIMNGNTTETAYDDDLNDYVCRLSIRHELWDGNDRHELGNTQF